MGARQKPKACRLTPRLRDGVQGPGVRLGYQREILRGEPAIPRPLEYEDIDREFFKFASESLPLEVNGARVPTFRLFSNQRFSEYSQTWSHVDGDQNLLMNFKTVARAPNPSAGRNQDGKWNIPGERWYTMYMREVLDDTGVECIEIASMRQPVAVDLKYRVSFVTNTLASLNAFNAEVHNAFKARQAYIRPCGHFIAMTLDDVSDETQYTIDERRFFVQQATITVTAYIVRKCDMSVRRVPKRVDCGLAGVLRRPAPEVAVEEYEREAAAPKGMDVFIEFEPFHEKVEFTMDEAMDVAEVLTENVRSLRLSVNGVPREHARGFALKAGDVVRIRRYAADRTAPSAVTLRGSSPDQTYVPGDAPENASEQGVDRETIVVE